MTVVYLDSVFALNALMDYLLLLCTGRLAGLPLRRGRYLLGALLGGVYAAAVFLPGCGALSRLPVKLAVGVLLALTAFGGERKLLRLTLLLFAVSCAMAGCVLALGLLAGGVPMARGVFYTDVSWRVLLVAASAAYLVLSVVFRAGCCRRLLPVRVCACGRTVTLTALADTGNGLRDPVTGTAILVADRDALAPLLPPEARRILREVPDAAEAFAVLHRTVPRLRARLVPYRAVGVSGGLLLAVRTDWTEVAGQRYPGLFAALSPTALGSGYTALWGGEIGRGGRYGERKTVETSGVAGPASGGERPLHRRQRRSAAAAEPGTGGRAAGAPDRGGRPAGADRT